MDYFNYAEEQLEYHKRKDERCENCKYKRRLIKLNAESSYCCSVYVNDKTDSDLFEIRLNEKCELYEREETEV